MGCSGCGSASILPGALSARKRIKTPRVRGYSGSGVIKSQKRLAKESGKVEVAKEMEEAANSTE